MTIRFKAVLLLAVALTAGSAARAEAPGGATARAEAQAIEVETGAGIFFKACSLCHDDSEHMLNDNGPALFGVVGRRVGSVEGYDYSPALLKAGARRHVWTEKRLDRFLSNPQHMYTGTGMPMMFNDPKVRHSLVAYLKSLRPRS